MDYKIYPKSPTDYACFALYFSEDLIAKETDKIMNVNTNYIRVQPMNITIPTTVTFDEEIKDE